MQVDILAIKQSLTLHLLEQHRRCPRANGNQFLRTSETHQGGRASNAAAEGWGHRQRIVR